MEEDGAAFSGDTRLLVEDGCALSLHVGKGSVNVLDFEADVMQALATFLQEFGEAGRRIGWLDQLDLAAARATKRQESDTYLLGWYLFDDAGADAQRVTIKIQSLFDIAYNDGNMINPFGHSTPPRMFEPGRPPGSPLHIKRQDEQKCRGDPGGRPATALGSLH